MRSATSSAMLSGGYVADPCQHGRLEELGIESMAQNVQTLPNCGSSSGLMWRSFLPMNPQISSHLQRVQDRFAFGVHDSRAALSDPPPSLMIVSRCTPVMRSMERILEPSANER